MKCDQFLKMRDSFGFYNTKLPYFLPYVSDLSSKTHLQVHCYLSSLLKDTMSVWLNTNDSLKRIRQYTYIWVG
jgi:hypothetical protein